MNEVSKSIIIHDFFPEKNQELKKIENCSPVFKNYIESLKEKFSRKNKNLLL